MPILSKGTTFADGDTVTSTKLNNLVDAATFAAGCVDDSTTQLSGGQIIIKNAGVTPTKLSVGHPNWDSDGNFSVDDNTSNDVTIGGTITAGGTIATSGNLEVNGTSLFTGSATMAANLKSTGLANRTVRMETSSGTPNAISFGWSGSTLIVQIDNSSFTIALTPV